ncbi:MAG TPA: DsrE family protein [Rhodanobacteraceae bacterium]|nr:DsrE family protein [Rhodanobacteraceae bacterium]
MHRIHPLASLGVLAFGLLVGATAFAASNTVAVDNASAAAWQTGVITSGGRIHPVPRGAKYMPDPAATYKVVFAVTRGSDDPGKISPGLERVARAVNLFTSAGVPLDHLQFVAIVYGAATPLSLDDKHYEDEFLVHNPNLPVIRELRKAGVDIVVCGQAVAEYKYQFEWMDKDVPVALAGVTTVTELQLKGYALMQL